MISCLPDRLREEIHWLLVGDGPMASQIREVGLPRTTEQINQQQLVRFVTRLEQRLGTLKQKRIALLGLSFKPFTDDLREAPAVRFCELSLAKGATITAYDPWVRQFPVLGGTIAPDSLIRNGTGRRPCDHDRLA